MATRVARSLHVLFVSALAAAPLLAAVPVLTAVLALQGCSSSNPEGPVPAEERFRMGMAEYADEDWFEAIQHFEVIRLQFPGSSVADSARYFCGMARYHREEYLLASYDFTQLITGGASPSLAADAQYMYAECYYQLSPPQELDQSYTMRAIDALQAFIEGYPKHPRVRDAEAQIAELREKLAEKEYRTGVLYAKMDNDDAALVYFTTVGDRYYNTSYADDALDATIRILVRKHRDQEARKAVARFLERYADSPLADGIRALQAQLVPQGGK
jgi:outer membrane protein assembly factor BamD